MIFLASYRFAPESQCSTHSNAAEGHDFGVITESLDGSFDGFGVIQCVQLAEQTAFLVQKRVVLHETLELAGHNFVPDFLWLAFLFQLCLDRLFSLCHDFGGQLTLTGELRNILLLYLTVDLDWFDPAVMPGTGTPEPGGFLWQHFAELVEELRHHRLVAADVVELAPSLDPSGVSAVLAAKVVRSLLLLLGR